MYRCSNCGKLLYYYMTGYNDDSTGMRSVNDIAALYIGVCPYCGKPLLKNKLLVNNNIKIKIVEQIVEKKRELRKL